MECWKDASHVKCDVGAISTSLSTVNNSSLSSRGVYIIFV